MKKKIKRSNYPMPTNNTIKENERIVLERIDWCISKDRSSYHIVSETETNNHIKAIGRLEKSGVIKIERKNSRGTSPVRGAFGKYKGYHERFEYEELFITRLEG